MLEYFDYFSLIIVILSVGGILWGIRSVVNALFKNKAIQKIPAVCAILGFMAGITICVISFFKGNFLAPFLSPILGPIGAIIFYIIGTAVDICIIIAKKILGINRSEYQSTIRVRLPKLQIASILIGSFIVLAIISYWKHRSELAVKYGDIMSNTLAELSIPEIKYAYSDYIFRNHNIFLRGLLMRPNVPSQIIADIYKRNQNENIIFRIKVHPNTPCRIVRQIMKTNLLKNAHLAKRYPRDPKFIAAKRCLVSK